ncbi:MAG: cation:proton antiporter [Nanoarchaeota archaeon]|nr:cation:proton antiporter [Nanoarchaeota archaeon]
MIEVISALLNQPEGLLIDLGLIIIVAAFTAYLARIFKQPLIPAYIVAGLILGPIGLKIIHDIEIINGISEIGIMFLLFLVGMEMDLQKLKKVGWVTIITGFFQVVLTFITGYFIATLIGFNSINSLYTGLIVAFSSTMVVIKLLSDDNKLSTLHGRIIIGILFMQDVLVIFALTIFIGTTEFTFANIFPLITKFLMLVLFAYFINKFLAFRLFRFAARSKELLFLLAIAFCFTFALLAYILGYSVAIGAFLGGIALANLPYSTNIVGRITPLKDFFAIIFFVALGLQLVSVNIITIWKPLLILLGIVVFVKPLIIMIVLSLLGYDKRNSFASAVSLAQISEFALILVMAVKNISQELFTITILLAILTITLTSYILKYELRLYNRLIPILKYFEKLSKKHQRLGYDKTQKKKIILVGSNKMGSMFLRSLKKVKNILLVIDFNPEIVEGLRKQKISSMYGDISNKEVLHHINFKHAKVVISSVMNLEDNIVLLRHLKEIQSNALSFVTAESMNEALDLYDAGADYVIIPTIMSGEQVANLLEKHMDDPNGLKKIKKQHLKHLLEMNAEDS